MDSRSETKKCKTEKFLKINEYPVDERPYEKLDLYGAEYLTDTELLAIIIKSGTKNKNAVEVAREIIISSDGNGGLDNIRTLSLEELVKVRGVGKKKAIQLKAVSEISKRLSVVSLPEKQVIRNSFDIINLLMPQMNEYCKEVVKVVFLNTKNHIIRIMDVSVGSLSASIIHPREIFRDAVKYSAASIIICHNHPSGDATPSKDDIETTKRLIEAGIIVGIQVMDHLVFGKNKCESIIKFIVNG